MKIFLKLLIFFFDIIDKFIHQKRILSFFKNKKVKIKYLIDVGSHKGLYTDLFLRNFKIEKIIMFEPQLKIYNFIKKNTTIKKKLKFTIMLFQIKIVFRIYN